MDRRAAAMNKFREMLNDDDFYSRMAGKCFVLHGNEIVFEADTVFECCDYREKRSMADLAFESESIVDRLMRTSR